MKIIAMFALTLATMPCHGQLLRAPLAPDPPAAVLADPWAGKVFVMFTSSTCPACQTQKPDWGLLDGLSLSCRSYLYRSESPPGWQPSPPLAGYPATILCVDGVERQRWTGVTSFDTFRNAIATLNSIPNAKATEAPGASSVASLPVGSSTPPGAFQSTPKTVLSPYPAPRLNADLPVRSDCCPGGVCPVNRDAAPALPILSAFRAEPTPAPVADHAAPVAEVPVAEVVPVFPVFRIEVPVQAEVKPSLRAGSVAEVVPVLP